MKEARRRRNDRLGISNEKEEEELPTSHQTTSSSSNQNNNGHGLTDQIMDEISERILFLKENADLDSNQRSQIEMEIDERKNEIVRLNQKRRRK